MPNSGIDIDLPNGGKCSHPHSLVASRGELNPEKPPFEVVVAWAWIRIRKTPKE